VCREVADLGVTVYESAGIDDLREAIQSHTVVTIVGHFALPPFSAADILDLDALLQSFSEPHAIEHSLLAEHLQAKAPWLLTPGFTTEETLKEALADEMNEFVRPAHSLYRAARDAREAEMRSIAFRRLEQRDAWTRLVLARATRASMEHAYPDELRAGACCELVDGLHSIPEFLGVIDEEFEGVLDLSLCSSVILAREVRRRWTGGLVVGNRYLAEVSSVFSLFNLTMCLLNIAEQAADGLNYQDALTGVEEGLGAAGQLEWSEASEQVDELVPVQSLDYGTWFDAVERELRSG
jgi:hypothetical protein